MMKSTKFMSANEKTKVLRAWQRFVKSGFDEAKFTRSLYNHLIMHCSFIAHYSKEGFYGTYFRNPEGTLCFLRQFDKDYGCKSVEYGRDYWLTDEEYHDLNIVMVDSFEPYKAGIYQKLKQKVIDTKLQQIKRLTAEMTRLKEAS